MQKFKKRILILLAFMIVLSTTVTAATVFNSKDIAYSNSATTKKNVKDSLDELYTKASKIGQCPEGQYCYSIPETISMTTVGDYIRMTPTSTSYTIPASVTGYTKDVVIHPNRLNLWRVIKKNSDGSVDAVSVYVDGVMIYISSLEGCRNFIGTLQTIASQYKNTKYTTATRSMGYEGQSSYCSSAAGCVYNDKSTLKDEILVENLFGDIVTTTPGGSSILYSWKTYRKTDSSTCELIKLNDRGSYGFYTYKSGGSLSTGSTIRPVVTIKGDVNVISGGGKTASTPYILE